MSSWVVDTSTCFGLVDGDGVMVGMAYGREHADRIVAAMNDVTEKYKLETAFTLAARSREVNRDRHVQLREAIETLAARHEFCAVPEHGGTFFCTLHRELKELLS